MGDSYFSSMKLYCTYYDDKQRAALVRFNGYGKGLMGTCLGMMYFPFMTRIMKL